MGVPRGMQGVLERGSGVSEKVVGYAKKITYHDLHDRAACHRIFFYSDFSRSREALINFRSFGSSFIDTKAVLYKQDFEVKICIT